MNKPRSGNFQTIIYADITTHEINGHNITTYKVLFNNPFENEKEVLELLSYIEKSGINYMISCNGKDITPDSLSSAVGELCFSMNEDTYLFIQDFLHKLNPGSYLSAKVENTRGYITGEVALLLPNNKND